jgi:hypothetical protein
MSATQKTASAWTPEKVEVTRAEVLRRAASDASFRRRCLTDPSGAIKEVSGLELPAGVPPVRFVERMEEMVIVLPPLTAGRTELADEDLALVAGGVGKRAQSLKAEAEAVEAEASSAWGKINAGVGVAGQQQQIR